MKRQIDELLLSTFGISDSVDSRLHWKFGEPLRLASPEGDDFGTRQRLSRSLKFQFKGFELKVDRAEALLFHWLWISQGGTTFRVRNLSHLSAVIHKTIYFSSVYWSTLAITEIFFGGGGHWQALVPALILLYFSFFQRGRIVFLRWAPVLNTLIWGIASFELIGTVGKPWMIWAAFALSFAVLFESHPFHQGAKPGRGGFWVASR